MMSTMELDTSLDGLKINKIITVSNSICRNNNFPALISWPVVFATSPVSALLWCLHPGCDLKGAARTFHRPRHSCCTKETSHLVTRLLALCALTLRLLGNLLTMRSSLIIGHRHQHFFHLSSTMDYEEDERVWACWIQLHWNTCCYNSLSWTQVSTLGSFSHLSEFLISVFVSH